MKSNSKWIRIIIVHRPPPSPDNHLTVRQFLSEFSSFLEQQVLLSGELLLIGDFNFHVDDNSGYYANQFQALIQRFGLVTTHSSGYTQRWLHLGSDYNKRRQYCSYSHIHVTPPWVSDLCIFHFKLTIPKPTFPQKTITFRKWTSMDLERFKQDILDAGLLMLDSVLNLTTQYNTKRTELADKHALVKSKTITECPGAVVYNRAQTGKETEEKTGETLQMHTYL